MSETTSRFAEISIHRAAQDYWTRATDPDIGPTRRKESRISCRKTIEIVRCNAGKASLRCELRDCSIRGLGIVMERSLKVGEQFLLKLRGGAAVVLYTIRSCRVDDSAKYRIGAEFTAYIVAPAAESRQSIVDTLMALA